LVDEFEREIRTQKNFNVLLMSFFNIDEVWLDFRKSAYWRTYRKIGFNMHKTLLCIVASLSLALVVNWCEESQTQLRTLQIARCNELGLECVENIGRDQCICAQLTKRSIISLVTVVLVGIAGFYVTYRQMMMIIVRNWLRLGVKDAVWFVDSLEEVKSNEDKDSREEVKDNVEKTGSHNVPKVHGFTLDRKAVVDDVFLIVFKAPRKNQFTRLVEFVEFLAKEVRDQRTPCIMTKKTPFTMTKDKLQEMLGEGVKESREEKCTLMEELLGKGKEEYFEKKFTFIKMKYLITRYIRTRRDPLVSDIYLVDLTRIIRNIIIKGTTMFTVVPYEDELLLLVANGRWSGGAFVPGDQNLKGISHLAIQHYDLSFSCKDRKLMIVPSYRFRNDYKEKCNIYEMNRHRSWSSTMNHVVDDIRTTNAEYPATADDEATTDDEASVDIISVNFLS